MKPKFFTLNGKLKNRHLIIIMVVLNAALFIAGAAAPICGGSC